MNYEPPTHLDLFSGVAGFSIAFEREGFRTIGFAEIDPYACAVLKKHYPGVPNYGDVRNVPALKCDVLTGGFPCQPFSVAGKQGGKSDDRYLWPAMLEVIERCRPTWILGENVPGIIGMELDGLLSDVERIGYSVQPFVVPACAVDAKHRRDRVWILAHHGHEGIHERGQLNRIETTRNEPGGMGGDGLSYGTESTQPHLANTQSIRPQGQRTSGQQVTCSHDAEAIPVCGCSDSEVWAVEPNVGRVVSGIPNRAHRIKCLGNSIVPRVAQVFAKAIYQSLNQEL